MTTRLVLACNDCEVIGPTLVIGRTVTCRSIPGRPRAAAMEARQDWADWFDGYSVNDVPYYEPDEGRWHTDGVEVTLGHAGHDVRLLPQDYDPMIPLHGWMPRPLHGPAHYAGRRHIQVIACPNCRAVYHRGDPNRRAVAYQTIDEGTAWFYFCRECSHVWGQAARERQVRATLTRTPEEEALWALQRQGIQDATANPRLLMDAPLDTTR